MIGLIIGGIILLLIEMMIPGFGIFGLTGLLLLLWGVYDGMGGGPMAMITVTGISIVGIIVLWWIISIFPKTKVGDRLTLRLQSTKEKGYASHPDPAAWLGKKGVAKTVLRPAGTIVVNDTFLDVVTDGEFYEPGTEVIIVSVMGGRIVVRATEK
ncbi:NfeD family protein [Veillonella sp. CHU110]|uniref:NfeD family protein n=1 Tax=Veillonella sp. CHU110 TaxID=2490947 RepID=UPI000F8D67F5|nr:NfeD family protein [Veillonella sp. CHU110]